MTTLPPEALESFKKAYAVEFGREVNDIEAERQAAALLDAFGTALEILCAAKKCSKAAPSEFESTPVSNRWPSKSTVGDTEDPLS